jgi:hypothetical protein
MVSEFVNLSERGMKSRGKKIKFYKVAPSWLEENIQEINYFAYFSLPREYGLFLLQVTLRNTFEIRLSATLVAARFK